MRRAATVRAIVRENAGILGAVASGERVWELGSVVAVLLTLSLVLLGEGAPGDLDPTFGVGGKVTTDFGGLEDRAPALLLQSDGKLVAAGFSQDVSGNTDFVLVRYLSDGRLDATFGAGGKVTTDFGGTGEGAQALVLQPDGKLVAAGGSGAGVGFGFALARYLPDGSLDPTFGIGGKVTTDFGGTDDRAFALVLQPDGKLVAAGISFSNASGGFDFALARYLPDGSLDPTFGIGGKVTTDFGNFDGAVALALQPDGKLVAAGFLQEDVGGNPNEDFALARYLPDGSLDPTFGTGGKVTTDFGGTGDGVAAIILQPDGKLVVAGASNAGGGFDFALARYLPDGSLDLTFGTRGKVTTDFGGEAQGVSLSLQPNGKLVTAGFSDAGGGFAFALARYLPDGSLDPTFGTRGKVTTDFGGLEDRASALLLQSDGKLVAAGFSQDVSGNRDFALARYLSPPLVNDFVTFEPVPSTFQFTPDPVGCPGGFVGKFSFEARLTNISDSSLTDLVVEVTTLTNGNLLHNAAGGPGGVGAQLTVPQQDGFTDGVLSPDELVDVPFSICLTQRRPFRFEVDVFGEES